MKIGIDVRALQWEHRYRGIGVYLTNLLEHLSRIDSKNQYIFFAWTGSNPVDNLALSQHFNYKVHALSKPSKGIIGQKLKNILMRDIRIKSNEIDVFLQPDPAFGLVKGTTPNVIVAYDLIELLFKKHHYPDSFTTLLRERGIKHSLGNKLRWRLYKWHLSQFEKSDAIIAISKSTKQDLLKQFNLAEQKISVVPLASPVQVQSRVSGITKPKPSILYVGAADYRKNISALIAEFEKVKLAIPNAILVLAGKDFGEKNIHEHIDIWEAINNSKYARDIHTKSYVSSKELINLYKTSAVFVYPSLYEGFGMPILEAMACECPVVSYNNSSIPEVAGSAALLVETGSDLSIPIIKVLSDKKLRVKLINKGKIQALKFSWENTAQTTLKILEMAAK